MFSDLKTFTNKGCKIAAEYFFKFFALLRKIFLVLVFLVRFTVFLPLLPNVQCPNFIDCLNPLGKLLVRIGLIFENICS